MSKIGEQRRQGDIFFIKVESIPEDAKVDKTGIISEGEVTGHTHRVDPNADAALMLAGSDMFVDARDEVTKIVHPEHGTVHLSTGSWSVVRQQENSPTGWRQVAD